ncbi:MAG: pyruvate, phosphate dikinase, partial [Loktanella sp.]|nr:pyruvate, phosphate dikinase [Loktanella sp.]
MNPVVHGGRAKCLQRLVRLDMPVPTTVALSFAAVYDIAIGVMPDMVAILAPFGPAPLLSVRPSSQDPDWGGPSAILNIGMNDARHATMIDEIGEKAATALYMRFVRAFAVHVSRLDPDEFDIPDNADRVTLAHMLDAYEHETDDPFPQDPAVQ